MSWGMSLLDRSESSALLILAVIGFRFMLLHKVPKITFMLLWTIALVRLLVPVSVHSQFSVFTAITHLGRMSAGQASPSLMLTLTQSSPLTDGGTVSIPPLAGFIPAVTLQQASWLSPIMLVWLIGFTLCALSFIVPHVKYRQRYQMSLPIAHDFIQQWQKSNPLWRKVQIRQSDTILTPLTYGIFKPVVLLPKHVDYTDEQQLKLILTHEYIHIKRFDTLYKWLLVAGVCIHWFNPFVWGMYILANRDIELSCDETVIRTFGESVKPAYARALVSLEEKRSGLSPMASHFAKNSIEERVISIMKTRKISLAAMLLAIVMVAGTVTVFATSALDNTKAAPGSDRTMAESTAFLDQGQSLNQGESSTAFMPIDLTFTKSDVPQLIDQLNASTYRAVYMDNEMALRITKDNSIWISISKDNGTDWRKQDAARIDAKDFADWLLKHDPIPGYSMKELQGRLANGAEVNHIVFENGKEMYVVADRNGVQLELVQPDKIASVLLDGQRMMITSERLPMLISAQLLKSFYDLLVSSSILTTTQAEQEYAVRVKHFKENATLFTLTN